MIKFEHNNGDLKCAVFAGSVSDLCADLCVEIALIYGATKKQSEKAAEEFKRNMLMTMIDKDIASSVFSTEIYDAVSGAGNHLVGGITISDKDEFARQLKELLNEDE